MRNLWPKIAPLLSSVERPSRYINHEWGSELPSAQEAFNFCMVYPDTYELGQSNQAVRILCNAVNADPRFRAERSYLPAIDMCDILRANKIPVFSLESCAPVCDFDAIGITLPHELCLTNVLEFLDLAGLAIRSQDRTESDPIVFGGGPCAFNPEPFSIFFDAISIGEGEQLMCEQLACVADMREIGASRKEILHALARIPGTYVPSLYEYAEGVQGFDGDARTFSADVCDGDARTLPELNLPRQLHPIYNDIPEVIEKRVFKGFSESLGYETCIVPFVECVHDRLTVEVLRGCARGCRFCQAGMMYRPVRERAADNIVESVIKGIAETGYDEVSLTSLSTTDHSQISEILTRLDSAFENTGVRISIPSQRLDSFGVDMASLVAGQKKGGLTFAPEAGTQRLRDVINKNVTEENLFSAVDAAFAAGWRRVKLYFMIGLPTETDEDVSGIGELASRVYERARAAVPPDQKGSVQVGVSVALFVPKSHTPFQWDGQIAPEEAQRRISLVRHAVKYRAIRVSWHDPKTSLIEAVMSRGGREVAYWVEDAFKHGARFDAWTELYSADAWACATEKASFDPQVIAQINLPVGSVLPWSHISCGVNPAFLKAERKRADAAITTPDCTFDTCTGCGACTNADYSNEIMEARHGI